MTDIDVTFLPDYNNIDPARLYVIILSSPPVSDTLQALGRVGCAVAFSINPRDSRVASPRVITFQLYQWPWIQKIDY